MYFGAQYYRPPFPDRTCWERDFLNMKQLGFHVVKLWAVWNDIERKPDHFVFDDLDRLTELAGKNGLKVIINTIPEDEITHQIRNFRIIHTESRPSPCRKVRIWCVISSSVLRSITVTTAV